MQKFDIGIIGNGFVGNALYNGMNDVANISVYDKDNAKSINPIEEVLASEIIFLCVPTPRDKNTGAIDMAYIHDCFNVIGSSKNILHKNVKVVIKSTVIPGTCKDLSQKYNLPVLSNPEFLTERYAQRDFNNPRCIVIGGDQLHVETLKAFYELKFPDQNFKYVLTDSTTSELIKYATNCFFSVKISFMNEMKQISDASGANWADLVKGFVADGRVFPQHLDVPGHDGLLGFGGKCLPKDTSAMSSYCVSKNIKPIMLNAALRKNKEIRQ